MRVEGRVGILQRTMVLGHRDWCQGVAKFQTKSDCVTDLSLVILQLRNWSCRLLWRYSWFIWNRNVMLNINEFWASQQMLQGSRRALEKHQIFFLIAVFYGSWVLLQNVPSGDGVWLAARQSFLSDLSELAVWTSTSCWLAAVILIHASDSELKVWNVTASSKKQNLLK